LLMCNLVFYTSRDRYREGEIIVFWDLTPWSLVDRFKRFGETSYLHRHYWTLETFRRNLLPPSSEFQISQVF
jgi:hypothetical protein